MFTLNCKGRLLVFERPVVMGILNLTPDSFYPGSRAGSLDDVLVRAEKMIHDGAAILDLGGQSTRPGSRPVETEEERARVLPAVEAVAKNFPGQLISIDTFYGPVAKDAVDAGAHIVNDVSAGSIDPSMLSTVAALNVPYVLMHMKGHPQNMQEAPEYNNVTLEVFDALNQKLAVLRSLGIKDVIIDPGFGFGKTIAHNFSLLRNMSYLKELQCPLMAGLSRKATVYKTLGITAAEALNGSTVMHTLALLNGSSILRVHDVKEAAEAVRLVDSYLK